MQQDAAAGWFDKTADQPEQGRLAAAAWAQQHEVLAAFNREADAGDGGNGAVALPQVDDLDGDIRRRPGHDITGSALARANLSSRSDRAKV